MQLKGAAGAPIRASQPQRVPNVNDCVVVAVDDEAGRRSISDAPIQAHVGAQRGLVQVAEQGPADPRKRALPGHLHNRIDQHREVRPAVTTAGFVTLKQRCHPREMAAGREPEHAHAVADQPPFRGSGASDGNGLARVVEHRRVPVAWGQSVPNDDSADAGCGQSATNRACLVFRVTRIPAAWEDDNDVARGFHVSGHVDRVRRMIAGLRANRAGSAVGPERSPTALLAPHSEHMAPNIARCAAHIRQSRHVVSHRV